MENGSINFANLRPGNTFRYQGTPYRVINVYEDNSYASSRSKPRHYFSRIIYTIESVSGYEYNFWEDEVLESFVDLIPEEEFESEVALWALKKA
jgi:hypothetical protein